MNSEHILNVLDINLAMFKRYPRCEDRVAGLIADRASLVDFFNGKVTFSDLAWTAKEWTFVMPDWGTYGT